MKREGEWHLTLIQEEVKEFLRKVPPFQFLGQEDIDSLSSSVSMEYYPKGTVILAQDGSPSRHLSVIKKGGVKVSIASEEEGEIVMDYRGEGDSFGFVSLIGADRARNSIIAIEDTICYQIEREKVIKLLEASPSFTEYFLKSFLIKSIDKTYQEMHKRSLLYVGGDKILFTTPVGELVTKNAITRSQDITIREAARVMTES